MQKDKRNGRFQVLRTDPKHVEVVWRPLGARCIFGILQSPGDLLGRYAFAFSRAAFHRTDWTSIPSTDGKTNDDIGACSSSMVSLQAVTLRIAWAITWDV